MAPAKKPARKTARKTTRKHPVKKVKENQPVLFSTDGDAVSDLPTGVDTSRDDAPDPVSRERSVKDPEGSAETPRGVEFEGQERELAPGEATDRSGTSAPGGNTGSEMVDGGTAKEDRPRSEGSRPARTGEGEGTKERGEHSRPGRSGAGGQSGNNPPQQRHGGGGNGGGKPRFDPSRNERGDRNERNDRNANRKKKKKGRTRPGGGGGGSPLPSGPRLRADGLVVETDVLFDPGMLPDEEALDEIETLAGWAAEQIDPAAEPLDFDRLYAAGFEDLLAEYEAGGHKLEMKPSRPRLLAEILKRAREARQPLRVSGTVDVLDDGWGLLLYLQDNYKVKALSVFIPEVILEMHGIRRGHDVVLRAVPPRENESCPVAFAIESVMGKSYEEVERQTPFTELIPYYPLERILLERPDAEKGWDNLSMRIVDLITPVGFGQRGLIVAPPRTGKTVLLQNIANSIRKNSPETHLMILLVDERPEEVTDFKRQVDAEVISSTFDESAESHVHAAEMVSERARCMVEDGRHVVILLDSITRLARAYNTMMPNSGKILSGGVEANALQKPKRFFGSARNIEGGGSLTILGTALVETGSKMDEVIFEEFKGTGNMELHLDRELANKRIYPALSMDRSGTRKEELLYHPDEMNKVFYLRRAMRGIPPVDAMEQLIQRVKKASTNAEFLMALGR